MADAKELGTGNEGTWPVDKATDVLLSLIKAVLDASLSGLLEALDDPSSRVAEMQPEWERDSQLDHHPLVAARAEG